MKIRAAMAKVPILIQATPGILWISYEVPELDEIFDPDKPDEPMVPTADDLVWRSICPLISVLPLN